MHGDIAICVSNVPILLGHCADHTIRQTSQKYLEIQCHVYSTVLGVDLHLLLWHVDQQLSQPSCHFVSPATYCTENQNMCHQLTGISTSVWKYQPSVLLEVELHAYGNSLLSQLLQQYYPAFPDEG